MTNPSPGLYISRGEREGVYMSIFLGLLSLVLFITAAIGWGHYFRLKAKLSFISDAVETIKEAYMTTVFAVWQHIEWLEIEYPEISQDITTKTMAAVTGWTSEEDESVSVENDVDNTGK